MTDTPARKYINDSDNSRPETASLLQDPPMIDNPSPFENNEVKVVDTSHIQRDALEKRHLAAYAVGHFSNDLCAAGWFFYLPYFLIKVVGITGEQAGNISLAG